MTEHLAGDFVLVDIRDLPGVFIRWGQYLNGDGFGEYAHACIYDGKGSVYEATPKHGVMHNPLDEYSTDQLLWSSGLVELTSGQRQAILTAAAGYTGVDYSFLDYAALAAHRLHIWSPGLKTFVGSTKHMICSQLVDQCYNDAGIQLFTDDRWPGYVTPGALFQLLKAKALI